MVPCWVTTWGWDRAGIFHSGGWVMWWCQLLWRSSSRIRTVIVGLTCSFSDGTKERTGTTGFIVWGERCLRWFWRFARSCFLLFSSFPWGSSDFRLQWFFIRGLAWWSRGGWGPVLRIWTFCLLLWFGQSEFPAVFLGRDGCGLRSFWVLRRSTICIWGVIWNWRPLWVC